MDFNTDMNAGLDGLDNLMGDLGSELGGLMGELGSELDNTAGQKELEMQSAAAEGFACLFPDWDLKPVRR